MTLVKIAEAIVREIWCPIDALIIDIPNLIHRWIAWDRDGQLRKIWGDRRPKL